ncbi:MAG TPA: NmrA family NAD(P)-binding protein [Nitrososphaera sp.]
MANNNGTAYAVVGASGNTGRIVAEQLLASGKKVRAIGRNADHLKSLVDKGAEPFVASVEDESALTKAFTGARAVYSMIPPNMAAADRTSYIDRVGEALAGAIADAHVPYVINLSSMAANKGEQGFQRRMYEQEQRLNRLPDAINVVHLRPPMFMENFLASINAIKKAGVIAYPIKPDIGIPMIATQDIASEAARLLLGLNFSGKSTKTLLGQRDVSMAEATRIIGRAINRNVRYVQVPYDEHIKTLVQAGLPLDVADTLTGLYRRMNEGVGIPAEKRTSENTTPTSFEQFAQKFAAIYNNNSNDSEAQ